MCQKVKTCRSDQFQKRIKKFGGLENLKKYYICQECKKKLREQKPINSSTIENGNYISFVKSLQEMIEEYKLIPKTPQNKIQFKINITSFLTNEGVNSYNFIIEDGNLVAIVVNIPIFRDLYIQL